MYDFKAKIIEVNDVNHPFKFTCTIAGKGVWEREGEGTEGRGREGKIRRMKGIKDRERE